MFHLDEEFGLWTGSGGPAYHVLACSSGSTLELSSYLWLFPAPSLQAQPFCLSLTPHMGQVQGHAPTHSVLTSQRFHTPEPVSYPGENVKFAGTGPSVPWLLAEEKVAPEYGARE